MNRENPLTDEERVLLALLQELREYLAILTQFLASKNERILCFRVLGTEPLVIQVLAVPIDAEAPTTDV
jgi:hypothetical protein